MSKVYYCTLIKTPEEAKEICPKIRRFYPADKIANYDMGKRGNSLETQLIYELMSGLSYQGFGRYVNLIYDNGYIDWGAPDARTGKCERGIELVSLNTFLTRTIKNYIHL